MVCDDIDTTTTSLNHTLEEAWTAFFWTGFDYLYGGQCHTLWWRSYALIHNRQSLVFYTWNLCCNGREYIRFFWNFMYIFYINRRNENVYLWENEACNSPGGNLMKVYLFFEKLFFFRNIFVIEWIIEWDLYNSHGGKLQDTCAWKDWGASVFVLFYWCFCIFFCVCIFFISVFVFSYWCFCILYQGYYLYFFFWCFCVLYCISYLYFVFLRRI